MTRDELNQRYFDWLCHFVYDDQYSKKTRYHKLMTHLHEIEFEYIIAMDGNRAVDGMDLRYRFAYENEYDNRMVAAYLDDRPCSMLEMMVALSVRMEEHIMEDSDIGDRTGQWFWNMIVNLGLGSMSDSKYDSDRVDAIIDRFIRRDYEPNGEGGLFKVDYPPRDMRSVDIWYQMHYYLSELTH